MTTDRYTKAVLTIIAGALIYIGAMLSGTPASAQIQGDAGLVSTRPQPVVIVGWQTMPPLPVAVEQQPLRVALDPSAPQQQPVAVTITGIRAGSPWDEIRAKVEQPLTRTPGVP